MNFFEAQARARKQTKGLVFMFAMAVLCIVVAIDAIVLVAWSMIAADDGAAPDPLKLLATPGPAIVVSLIVLAVIAVSSLFKTMQLRGGGGDVARQMGGTQVTADTQNPRFRRLRNVVEEMAIASGVPVPDIYVLEQEAGINAFAAGLSASDAAVAVTQGALDKLTRDELQGVIAHEFSHVLNGDMRLNVRLMGLCFGILVIALAARSVLRHARGGDGKKGGAIIIAALGIMIVGYLGVVFARLIKAGVSRQREFLADASAVQFTRQNAGLSGALKKIAGYAQGSKLERADGEEVAHMLFGDGVGYSSLFATHPPLIDRIRKLDPRFDPRELNEVSKALESTRGILEDDESAVMGLAAAERRYGTADDSIAIAPAGAVAQVANPDREQMRFARTLRASLPQTLKDAARASDQSAHVVLALLVDSDEQGLRAREMELLTDHLATAEIDAVKVIAQRTRELNRLQRLPLALIALPALKRRPRAQVERFRATVHALVRCDGQVDLFEYCLATLIDRHLADSVNGVAPGRATRRLPAVRSELAALLAILAHHGHEASSDSRAAYQAGASIAFGDAAIAYAPPADWQSAMDGALTALDALVPAGKEVVVEALVRVMAHDGRITVAEAELLRTVCACLHCPMPPLLDAAVASSAD